jgi:hypothetical protein
MFSSNVVERKLALSVCLDRRGMARIEGCSVAFSRRNNFARLDMKLNHDAARRRITNSIRVFVGLTLALAFAAHTAAAQAQPAEAKLAESKLTSDIYQTFYLTNRQQNDASELQTDLRNILPRAKVYYVPSQGALSLRGAPEDILLAQKILTEIDRPMKSYRLTYTITETDGGKLVGTQHFSLVVGSGAKTEFKEGNRVPIVTGSSDAGGQKSQVQYVDVGLSIEASLAGPTLHTMIEKSSLSEEKSSMGAQDPVIRQTKLDETSTLVEGKSLTLGTLDIPGSTRHREIEVVSELVR